MKDIPALRTSRLKKLVARFMQAPSLVLTKLFGSDNSPTESIDWESEHGSRGLTPFGSEDAPAPQTSPGGIAEHSAHAAYWHEKMHLAASDMNNLREPGTPTKAPSPKLQAAKKYIAKQLQRLRNRCDRRQEWMTAKMLQDGILSYLDRKGAKRTVSYGIPTSQIVTLGATRKWNVDTAKIVEDIMDVNITLQNANTGMVTHALFPTEILKLMIVDKTIQSLLQKSSFGSGDLFLKPIPVLGSLLNIPNMILYDEAFQLRSWLTQALSSGAGPHTVYVDDTTDYEVGGTLTVEDISAKTKETLTISAVDHNAGTITATGTLTNSYKALEDGVYMTKKFLSTSKFTMFASAVEGQPIAEFMYAPYGNEHQWGVDVDQWEEKDPDGRFVRVRNKGLPVLYFEDAVYTLTVI